jgi:hypothetical protein
MFCCRTIRVAFWRYGICHPPAPPGGQHRLARLPERQPYSLPVSRRTSSPTCPASQSGLCGPASTASLDPRRSGGFDAPPTRRLLTEMAQHC